MNKKTKRNILLILLAVFLISLTWILASIRVAQDFMWETHTADVQICDGGEIKPVKITVVDIPQATPDDIELEMYYDSLEYLAQAVQAEANNQGLYGKQLVARVILNRVKSDLFPDDITSVINAPHQFEVVSNGSIYRNIPNEETIRAVQNELSKSSDDRILFFTAGRYNGSGTPLYNYKDHYFSGR